MRRAGRFYRGKHGLQLGERLKTWTIRPHRAGGRASAYRPGPASVQGARLDVVVLLSFGGGTQLRARRGQGWCIVPRTGLGVAGNDGKNLVVLAGGRRGRRGLDLGRVHGSWRGRLRRRRMGADRTVRAHGVAGQLRRTVRRGVFQHRYDDLAVLGGVRPRRGGDGGGLPALRVGGVPRPALRLRLALLAGGAGSAGVLPRLAAVPHAPRLGGLRRRDQRGPHRRRPDSDADWPERESDANQHGRA